ncbi:MAG: kelch repeat-containing protein, partial [Chthoniobacterales bacterium]
GSNWTQQLPVTPPPPRYFAGLAPDATGNVVLYGGSFELQSLSDTWTWDGMNWTLRSANSPPGRRSAMSVAYDSVAKKVLLFGGQRPSGALSVDYLDDTWTWNGAQWARVNLAIPPPPRSEMGFAYDAARKNIVLFGGWTGQESLADTWIWNGSRWAERHPDVSPPERSLPQMAYDAERQETVLFGGFSNGAMLGDTWIWNGQSWSLRTPPLSPPPRYGGTMAYDAVSKRIVLFSGNITGTDANDTWTWDGTSWTQQQPANAPPARYRAALAYHSAGGKLVLFGGFDNAFNLLNDTWTWDGNNWTEEHPANSPTPRYSASASDDPTLDAVLLFGGSNGEPTAEGDFADTWLWDGSNWTRQNVTAPPDRRFSAGIAFDEARRKIVMFGGSNINNAGLRDTWFWKPIRPLPVRLVNISSRARVLTDEEVLIGGFIITGLEPKKVIVRGVGPSMRVNDNPVAGRLKNPALELHNGRGVTVAANDNWKDAPNRAEIKASGLAPGDEREAAILLSLRPGSYTAIMKGVDTTGLGLVEVYDLEPDNRSQLANVSTRAKVLTNDDVLIGGVIARRGNSSRVLFRAVGPSLRKKGVLGALENPTLALHDGNGALITSNDNWRDAPNSGEIQFSGLAPLNRRESAILTTIRPGNYTAIVRGKNETTGVGLVEAYNLGNP